MRDLIVEELAVAAPPEQVAKARKLIESAGNIAAQLVELGFAPRDVLQACCAVTGVPPAPQGWLRDPKPPRIEGLDGDLCRRLGAAPVATQSGRLCIAYLDPEIALRADALGFPAHQAYLALKKDLDKALALLPSLPAEEPPVDDESNLFDDIPPEPDDGATVVSAPIRFDDAPDTSEGGAASESDDDVLFDDPTRSLAQPPIAPKPVRRQQSGAVDHDTLVTSPAAKASAPAAAKPAASSRLSGVPSTNSTPGGSTTSSAASGSGTATATVAGGFDVDIPPTATTKKRVPSLATPSHGSTAAGAPMQDLHARETVRTPGPSPKPRGEHSGLRAAGGDDDGPAETLITPAPDRAALNVGDHPAARLPSRADVKPPREAPKPAKPRVDTAASELPTRATTPPKGPSESTQVRALRELSADDLASDEDEAISDEVPAATPTSMKDGTRAVAPASAATMTRAEQPPAQPERGAFASSSSATDQEAVQSQKQRLKRIAQIASVKRYKIERVLGRGGMATVYFATDTKTGQPCALKLMEPHLAEDAVFVERFKREIRASTSLNHENIVRVFDYGEEGGTYYMASEFVDGGTVASLLKATDRPLPVALVVPMMIGFLNGLEHAHGQGFVHRDLKPANLMLTSSGVVKIGDFGIAKAQTDSTLTKTGALFGTPAYMSPEQAQGQELDTRSDLFGVGIIFYELLAGYNPYAHENPSTTMFAIAKGQVRAIFDANPTVPEAVEKVVHKLLEKDLKKRYQAAGQARDDLQVIAQLVAEKFPTAVADSLRDPEGAVDALSCAQSLLESERATKLLKKSPPEHAEAAFRYYKATLLDPKNYEAVNGLTQLRADYGFRFTRPDDRQMLELEQSLEKKPDQPAVLRRLADLSATHRNLVDMAGFMKRYLRFFPNDTHVLHKLERILGNDPLSPFSLLPVETTDSTAAWSASDEMLDAARAAAVEESGPTPGKGSAVRPAARPGGAAVRAGATPATAQAPVSADKRTPSAGAGKAVESGPSAPSPASLEVERPELPPPKDSLEAVLRGLRYFLEDVVRSVTGDQGFAGVREALKERFGEGSGDLKHVMKGALGKGKEVVADSLLKEEGRQALKRTFTGTVQKHWRLAVLVVGFFVVLAGLTKACSLACGAAPEEPVKKAPAHTKGDAAHAAQPAPAPVAAKPAAADAATPADNNLPDAGISAEEAERLLNGDQKPKAPVDAKAELAARQELLKAKAHAETDPAKAIDLYTQAIDTDPYAPGSRDALLERAKLYQAQGKLDLAQADLFRLQRRVDVAPIHKTVDDMLADIAKAMKKQAEAQQPAQP